MGLKTLIKIKIGQPVRHHRQPITLHKCALSNLLLLCFFFSLSLTRFLSPPPSFHLSRLQPAHLGSSSSSFHSAVHDSPSHPRLRSHHPLSLSRSSLRLSSPSLLLSPSSFLDIHLPSSCAHSTPNKHIFSCCHSLAIFSSIFYSRLLFGVKTLVFIVISFPFAFFLSSFATL